MSPATTALILVGAVVGGALNSVVGGGSFVCFPALVFAGVPAVAANATTTLVLWPAALASSVAYRRELTRSRSILLAFGLASLAGGGLGGLLLIRTSDTTFARLVPWLMLFASLLFSFGGLLTRRLGPRSGVSRAALIVGAVVQFAISVYGGYFGGGMGIMMLAAWTALGMSDLHAMNGLRTLCGVLANAVALAQFAAHRLVAWGPGLMMALGATVAGYLGAAVARRLDAKWVRRFVLVVAWAMTVYFFVAELV